MCLSDIPPLWKPSLSLELPVPLRRHPLHSFSALPYISPRMRIDITEEGQGARSKSRMPNTNSAYLLRFLTQGSYRKRETKAFYEQRGLFKFAFFLNLHLHWENVNAGWLVGFLIKKPLKYVNIEVEKRWVCWLNCRSSSSPLFSMKYVSFWVICFLSLGTNSCLKKIELDDS